MPGLGNPLTELDIVDFNRYSEQVATIAKFARGTLTQRDAMLLGAGV